MGGRKKGAQGCPQGTNEAKYITHLSSVSSLHTATQSCAPWCLIIIIHFQSGPRQQAVTSWETNGTKPFLSILTVTQQLLLKKINGKKMQMKGSFIFGAFFFFLNLGQIVAQHSSEGSGELHVYINREFRVVWFGLRS